MNYVMRLRYDGEPFNGFATQPHKNTIEDITNATLTKIFNENIKIVGSARTDSKVHALDQVIMFKSKKSIDIDKLKLAYNSLTPPAIYCHEVSIKADDFHVRYDMKSKTYRYHIVKEFDPFKRRYAYHHRKKIDVEILKSEAKKLVGEHDFTSFCASGTSVKNKVRKINFINILEEGNNIIIEVNANGFLYNMMRIIAGTLIEISTGKLATDIDYIIECKNRNKAGKTAPAQGLFLYESIYEN